MGIIGKYGILLMVCNAGFISSTVKGAPVKGLGFKAD